MGRIVWNGRGYHNHRYIFPVGFRSKKQYTSLSDTSKKTYFISEILDGGEQPIFQITLEDMPEKVFRHSSSSGAWELALKGLMELGFNAKTHASGPDMYGLTNLGVIKYIQEMPNAHRCRRYMPLKWIIDEENVEGGSPDSSGQGFKSYDGGKPGSRRKKFNNSLYASNHDVLLSTLEEAAASSVSSHKVPTSPPSRPYTPRKYTRRKVNDSSATNDLTRQQPCPDPFLVKGLITRRGSRATHPNYHHPMPTLCMSEAKIHATITTPTSSPSWSPKERRNSLTSGIRTDATI
ncbi:MAG: F/Y rich C-terminus-domain-containing protein [Linnemannia elongata]|nr:MAG: F/Y rich C-terminus-domain-containing protein [Linnemannia elongata]